ncbi:MAG: aminomethyl-transferring glycine dehydrogenase subunit GcvPA [Chloracidobacterium sp.]|nr:aminomethyl-transferring glycine dehydrogenase subunit GcvPA [Chloracidobacterium sp.]MDW8216375.1 aminomethyl-transferring glycine dehydrogenase subunit GcvPA [Acidobacteriota bacterium]
MRYIPNATPEERASMLATLGLSTIAELFRGIPEDLKLQRPLNLPPAASEAELTALFESLAGQNILPRASFLGAGVYDHVRPLIIDTLVSRSEFYTSYTPYQPEINQGTLQAIFEYQTFICQLTGMDVSNASMYDGATALAEAMLMAVRLTNRYRVIMSAGVHPEYQAVCETYARRAGLELVIAPLAEDGTTAPVEALINDAVACVAVQSPNFFGCIEDVAPVAEAARKHKALTVVAVAEAMSLGVLAPPGEVGADVVVGEGQSLGIPPSFGGPHLGFFAAREQFARQMPGRLIGQAYDAEGNRGFVITLATREQHIRREKATSNICSNEGLCALVAAIFLSTVGRRGFQELATRNIQKAAYLKNALAALPGFELVYRAPVFNEFVVRTPAPAAQIVDELLAEGILAGLPLSRYFPERTHELLVCATENTTRAAMDDFAAKLARYSVG